MADCVVVNKCCVKTSGTLYLGIYDPCCGTGTAGVDPFPLVSFGNASDLGINVTTTDTTVEDYESRSGGVACSDSVIDNVTVTASGKCLSVNNFARQYGGDVQETAAAVNVAFTGRIRAKGQFIPFRSADGKPLTGVDPASVNLTTPSGLVRGVDYTVNENGIKILDAAPNIPDVIPASGLSLTGDLDHGQLSLVQLLTSSTTEYHLFLDAYNTAGSSAISGHLWRVKPKANGGATFLSREFASFEFEATVLKSACVTGQGASTYGTFAF